MKEISIEELEKWKAEGKKYLLVDVREEDERMQFHIGGEWIPLAEIPQHQERIPMDIPVVFYCRRGVRSAVAIHQLQEMKPYTNLINLKGGIGG